MKDKKTMKNGFAKKGLVLCLAGVMAFGMMACGNSDKKKGVTQREVKTESNEVKKKEEGSANKTDITRPKSNTGMKKQDDKADAAQSKNNTGTQKQDKQPKNNTGTQKQDDNNTKRGIEDTQTNKTKDDNASKR
ncbi:MAG: hypothetical protein HFH51_16225 [Lachnospiraceae bacterium]|nr:hypothetical protein [Lachnospiraceae bacterium]